MSTGKARDELVLLLKSAYPDFNGGQATIGRLMDQWYPPIIPWRWEMRGGKQVKVTDSSLAAIKVLIDHKHELKKGRLRVRTEAIHVRAPTEVLLHAASRDFSALYHEIIRSEPVGLYGRVEKKRSTTVEALSPNGNNRYDQ